jgi:hypothetical protein
VEGNETLRGELRRATGARGAARAVTAVALAAAAATSWAATQTKTTGASTTPAKAASTSTAPAARAGSGKEVPLPPPPTGATADGRRWIGASIGALNSFGVGQSLAVQLDYGMLRTPPTWRRFDLEWHLVVGFAAPSGKTELTAPVMTPFGMPIQVSSGQEKVSAYLLEVVPTARILYTVTRGVAFFADGGLGLCQSVESYDRTEMYLGHSTHKEYATGIALRAALGMAADVSPRWRLLLVPVGFSLQLGPKFSGFTPSLGLAYRLQASGDRP